MDIDTVPTIIAAKAGEGSQIVIWRKTKARESASEPQRAEAHTGDRTGKANIMQILMLIALLAFVWQNMEVRSNLSQKIWKRSSIPDHHNDSGQSLSVSLTFSVQWHVSHVSQTWLEYILLFPKIRIIRYHTRRQYAMMCNGVHVAYQNDDSDG